MIDRFLILEYITITQLELRKGDGRDRRKGENMSKFVPKIEIKPGIPPIYKDGSEPPSGHWNFGPDDTANAVKVLVEACKLWPDDLVGQIEAVNISWAGYFKPCYKFIIMANTSHIDVWSGD